jgi:predicted nucleotidyltransferase
VTRIPLLGEGGRVIQPTHTVAVITKSPADLQHPYRARLTDGREISIRREDFTLLKRWQREGWHDSAHDGLGPDWRAHIIMRCVVGSRAYGLDEEHSDIDRRGIYLAPAEAHWSLIAPPEQIELDATQECYWELQKFLTLALKANPNVLECLYTPLLEHVSPMGAEILEARDCFVSKLVYQTYNGYVLSQFKKIRARLDANREVKWKHAMHLLRLLLAGIVTLQEGYVPVKVEEHREQLLAIRRGSIPWPQIDAWRLQLHRDFDAAFAATQLPEMPDYARANALLLEARRRQAGVIGRGMPSTVPPFAAASCDADHVVGICPSLRGRLEPLRDVLSAQPYALLFVTISGAHLYGFASPDSDFDLRGVHVLPVREVVGLEACRETIEAACKPHNLEVDLVTHDALKFFRMLLQRNGYVLEQLYSPLVLQTSAEHAELQQIARGCVTRHHVHHYLGFFQTQWRLFGKDRRIKPLLYAYRVLLTGIHLMRTGIVEANILRLNDLFHLPYINDLVDRKMGGAENMLVEGADLAFHARETQRLADELQAAYEASSLPETPTARDALNDLLVRLRGCG